MTPVKCKQPRGISATDSINAQSGKLHWVQAYSLGKERPPVAFHIAHGILKYIGNSIDLDFSVYTVMHTVNAVPALHEWNILKRSHNVILDGRKSTEVNRSCDMEFGSMDIQ